MNRASGTEQSLVTAILPESTTEHVLSLLAQRQGSSGLVWQARGTLLREHWLARWMPPIEPGKTVLQMVVPAAAADGVMAFVADGARLTQQATGAVFALPSTYCHVGSGFHQWSDEELATFTGERAGFGDSLHLICCIVGASRSERVARAAVEAGAHGPIVYLSEGRGLRDRIGWLRITKDHQQEVQMVVVDEAQLDDVFNTMAQAGRFHLPGRGLLYAMPLGRGTVNLPSRFSRHRDVADLHQIVRAIDHLAGHSEWRDAPGPSGSRPSEPRASFDTPDRVALTAVVRSEHVDRVTDLILDGGAGGLNRVDGRFVGADDLNPEMGARVQHEYVVLRSIVACEVADYIGKVVAGSAEDLGVRDLCLLMHPVARFARYQHGAVDYRAGARAASA